MVHDAAWGAEERATAFEQRLSNVLAGGALCGIVVVYLGFSFFELVGNGLILATLVLGVVLGVVATLVLALALRGRPHWRRLVVISGLTLMLGCPAWLCGGALVVNCALDDGPTTSHEVSVVSHSEATGRVSTRRLVTVTSWRPGEAEVTLQARGSGLGPRLVVHTMPGALGAEWVVGVDAAETLRASQAAQRLPSAGMAGTLNDPQ